MKNKEECMTKEVTVLETSVIRERGSLMGRTMVCMNERT